MIDRAIEFAKLHAYDTVLALFILVSGGSIVALWSTITAAFVEYPVVLCLACCLSFLLGLLVSAMRDRRAATLKQIEENTKLEIERLDREERQRAQEKEEAARRELEREAERERDEEVQRIFKKKIMEMDFDTKAALFMVYTRKGVELMWVDRYEDYPWSTPEIVISLDCMFDNLYDCKFSSTKRRGRATAFGRCPRTWPCWWMKTRVCSPSSRKGLTSCGKSSFRIPTIRSEERLGADHGYQEDRKREMARAGRCWHNMEGEARSAH